MKRLKHISLISAILLALLIRCDKNDDSEIKHDPPPSIFGWLDTLTVEVDDTLVIDYIHVSPSDKVTFEWFLDNVSVSDSLVFKYVFTEIGEYNLRFEVTRFDSINRREANIIVFKTVRLVCDESGWKIEGEDGKANYSSSSWRIWDNRGWVDLKDVTLTFENSGNSYEIHIESFLAFIEGMGVVRYSTVTATGGFFGSDTVDCSYP